MQGNGPAAEPFGAGWSQVGITPYDLDMVSIREPEHFRHYSCEAGVVIGAAFRKGAPHDDVAVSSDFEFGAINSAARSAAAPTRVG